ncbi:uncharacterized protein BJX67DRAFT_352497 [Aspergillus lucknowensis]|uniref:Uncharacterized protein n=1 Tax=Aspergillus lucknowensis TaxID=176173 RepID=A0ABR4LSI8_9EURO
MCDFDVRVHRCGHYRKCLKRPCGEAKYRQTVCSAAYDKDRSEMRRYLYPRGPIWECLTSSVSGWPFGYGRDVAGQGY